MQSLSHLGILAVTTFTVTSCGMNASSGSIPPTPHRSHPHTLASIPGVPEGVIQYGYVTVTAAPRKAHTVSEKQAQATALSILSSQGFESQLQFKGAVLADITNRSVAPPKSSFDWLLIYFSSSGLQDGQGCTPTFCQRPYHYYHVAISATSGQIDNTYTGVIPVNHPT